MKRTLFFLAIVSLILAGCRYVAPLTAQHTIPVDPALLGLWDKVDQNGEHPDERLLILKFSKTEYLIYDGSVYYRGYNIKIGKIPCLQVQIIGGESGPDIEDVGRYDVATYAFRNNELRVRILNSNKVSDELKDSVSLRRAFLKHQNDKDLFVKEIRFHRLQ